MPRSLCCRLRRRGCCACSALTRRNECLTRAIRRPRSRSTGRTRRAGRRSSSSTGSGCCRAAGIAGRSSSRRPATPPLTPGWPDDPETVDGGERASRGVRPQDCRAGRRPLRRRDRQARAEARRDRALVRRAARPDPRRTRPRGGVGRDRPGAVPRRAAAADLGAQVGVAGARQSRQPQPRGPAHLRAVPLRLRQRRQRGRGEGAVRDVRGAGLGRAALPGGDRQPQPVDRGEGGHARTPSAGRC